MNTVLDAFVFGLGVGMNTGFVLALFADTLTNVKNAILDIIRGESDNQTKEEYIK